MTHLDQALHRALSCPHTAQTFATLDRHAASGRFDPDRALALLRRNARDATPHTPSHVRDAVAARLLTHWRDSRSTVAHTETE